MKRIILVVAAAITLAGCAGEPTESEVVLAEAYQTCINKADPPSGDDTVQLVDDQTIVGTEDEDTHTQAYYETVVCLFQELEAGAGLEAQFKATTADSGTQSETENGYEYTWSARPVPYTQHIAFDIVIEEKA